LFIRESVAWHDAAVNRREILGGLGVASASTVLWALGCSGTQKPTSVVAEAVADRDSVRAWLRDAVSRLRAVFPTVHALAVERLRSTAASDALGTGLAHARRDGVVLVVRDEAGMWREQVTSDLSKRGVANAVRALVGTSKKSMSVDFGPVPPALEAPKPFSDAELRNRVEAITRKRVDSRVVYGVSLYDIEDTWLFSIAPGRDLETRARRVRQSVIRAAWNGPGPVVGTVERGWVGKLVDPRALGEADAERATEFALEMMTPAAFPDGRHTLVLDPSVTASLVDTGTRALLSTSAARRPEVKRGIALGATVASPLLTLVDDPTTRGSYGSFAFDDEGEPAAPLTLIDKGRLVGVLGDRAGGGRGRGLRAGHVGAVEPSPSHLRVVAGSTPHGDLRDDGFLIEGGLGAVVDPGTTRVVIAAARARVIKGGKPTGHVYPDVELVGDLGLLFGSVTGVSSDAQVFDIRDERDGEPRWRSVEAPWLRIPLGDAKQPGVVRARQPTDRGRS
jgi:predicted Zn-dependent protease